MNDKSADQPQRLIPGLDPVPWTLWTRRVATVVLLAVVVFLSTFLGPIASIVVLSTIFAYILFIPIRILATRTRLSYHVSVAIVLVITILVGGVVSLNLAADFASFASQLTADSHRAVQNAENFLLNYTPDQGVITIANGRTIDLNPILEPLSTLVQQMPAPRLQRMISSALSFISGSANTILDVMGNLLIIMIMTAVFLVEFPNYYRWFMNTSEESSRQQNRILLQRSERVWHNFFRGSLTVAGIMGILTTIQFVLMGVPYAVPVGILTAFFFVIPIIGGFIALVPITLVPLFYGSSTLAMSPTEVAIAVLAVNFVIQIIVWNVIQPIVMVDAIKIPIAIYLLGVIVGASLGGALGAFLILPLIGIGRELLTFIYKKIQVTDPYPGVPDPVLRMDVILAAHPPKPAIALPVEVPVSSSDAVSKPTDDP